MENQDLGQPLCDYHRDGDGSPCPRITGGGLRGTEISDERHSTVDEPCGMYARRVDRLLVERV